MMDLPHVRLKADPERIGTFAAQAATDVADAGGSPRAQLDAANALSSRTLGYLPHEGRRQRERTLRRMAKQAGRTT